MASIRERNGKFNVIYSYTNEKGERKQKWETYETKAEAKRRKKEIEYKKEMGSFVVRKCKTLDNGSTEPSIYKLSSRAPRFFARTRAYSYLLSCPDTDSLCYQHPSCLFADVDCCISISVHLISARTAVNSFG